MAGESNDHKRRLISVLVILLVMAGLTWLGYRINPFVTLRMCLAHPDLYDGREIPLGVDTRLDRLVPEGFIIMQSDLTIQVRGDPQTARPGDFVSLRGVFHKEGYLDLTALYVAKGRRLKILVSIFPALLVLVLLIKTYTFDRRGLVLRERGR